MAAILKLRRASSIPSLAESELFYNTSNATLNVGKSSGVITLVKISELNTGNLQITGTLSGSALTLSGDITANNAHFKGDVRLDGQLYLGDVPTDNVNVNAQFSGSLIPSSSNVFDLGSNTSQWRTIYGGTINGSITDTNILNFTSSQQAKNSTLATYTGSVDSKLTNLINHTGSYATTGSNNFIGNQSITGSIFATGQSIEFNMDYPPSGSEKHFLKTNGFTINDREYEYSALALEHYHDIDFNAYHNALMMYMFSPGGTYGNTMTISPYETHLRIYPRSGSNPGNVSVRDTDDGKSLVKLNGNVISIGNTDTDLIQIGNYGTQLQISGSINVQQTITGSLSGSIYGISNTLQYSQSVDSRLKNMEDSDIIQNNSVSLLNQYTGSQNTKNSALATYTGSNNSNITELFSTASNHETRINGIQSYTSSLRTAIGVSGTDVTINGNLSVLGTTTQINSTQVNIGENILELNYGGSATTSGIITKDATGGSTISGSLLWDATNDYWKGGKLGNESKVLLAGGDGIVSGSAQVVDALKFTFLEINGDSVVSGSSQIDLTQTTNYATGIKTQLNANTVISGSSQVNADTITNFDSNVKDKLNADGVVSGSIQVTASLDGRYELQGRNIVSGSQQVTASLDGRYELQGRNVVSGSSQVTSSLDGRYALSSSFSNLVGAWNFGTQGSLRDAAFYSVTSSADIVLVSGSINYNNNHLLTAGATKKYIDWRTDELLTAIGAADITSVTTGNDGISGGGTVGAVTLSLDTASATFTNGVKTKLNTDGVISGSSQVSYLGLSNIPAGIVSGSSQIVSILGPLNTFSASQETKNTTLATYTASVDSHITAINTFTSSINTTIKSKMDADGVISGSSQLDGKFINNLSGSFTGSFKGNVNGIATYSTNATVTNVSNNADYAVVLTTAGVNGYLGLSTDGVGGMYWNPSVNKLSLTGSVEVVTGGITGSIAATNGVISGSSQIVSILGPLNTYTASQDTKNTTLGTYTGSIDTKFGTLATYTGSVDSSLSQLNAVSHSHSNKTNLDTINQNLATTSNVTFGSINTTGTGSIGTNLTVYGNLTVWGTQSIINSTNTEIADNILYLAPSGAVDNDLGIVGHYNDGAYKHAGIFMDASDGHAWKVFNGLTTETTGSVDTSAPSFTLADFKAGVFTGTSFNGIINATNGIVSGSSQITLSSTTGGGTSANVQFGSLGIGMAASGTSGRIDATNDIVAYSSSDRRFKDNIKPIENALDKINQIGGYEFDWKEENKIEHGYEGHDLGVIAQEIEAIAPELVQTRENGYKAVKYDKLVSVLIQAVKELSAKVQELENK